MFKRFQALKQAVKTITSTKPKTTTRKSNLIKGANKRIKDLEKAVKSQTDLMNVAKQNKNIDRKDIVPVAKNIREGKKIIREVEGVKKDIYKRDFKKGGRIGFNKGTGRTGVPAMDIKSKISLAKKKKKNNKGK
jgi:hypothetical protein